MFRLVRTVAASLSTISTTAAMAMERPYGAWESPITSKSITAGSVKLGGLYLNNGDLYWLEGRPQEGGRNVLCRHADGDKQTVVEVTPKDSNVRTRVHEYGGGAVTMGNKKQNGSEAIILFSEFATQQLCQVVKPGFAKPITPEVENQRFRFADGDLLCKAGDADTRLYCVLEDHEKPAPKDVVNAIAAVSIADGSIATVASGRDFYAAPRLSPDGTKLAYIAWNHPNMPWDATELRITTTALDGEEVSTDQHELIAGGDGDTSVLQPLWHPSSGELYYISDQSGYYNIYRAGYQRSILPMEADFGGAAPGWMLGQQGFAFLPDGRLVAQYKKDGESVLLVATVNSEGPATDVHEYGKKDGLPMQFGGVVPDPESDDLYFQGGSPSTSASIYKWNLAKKEPAEILVCSSSLSFPDDIISIPKQIAFPTTLGEAYGYYYPPTNAGYKCTTEKAPPLLVKAHGGPTACTGTMFNAGIQYWTSRGFAVLDVDYGGSTGYGREYRRRLRKAWGIVDIDDVCAGAQYLVKEGLADGNRLCIDGGSAGGFTTLAALAFRDVFKAGCSLYGVADLSALAGDTHKFESRYLDGLVGPYPDDEKIYKERSPIESVDTLSCPILILQGDEDQIVPPNQAKLMHEALLQKGIPTCLKIYEGEQHGFRRAENIEDALDSELAFYGKVFGIDVPDAVDIAIDNM